MYLRVASRGRVRAVGRGVGDFAESRGYRSTADTREGFGWTSSVGPFVFDLRSLGMLVAWQSACGVLGAGRVRGRREFGRDEELGHAPRGDAVGEVPGSFRVTLGARRDRVGGAGVEGRRRRPPGRTPARRVMRQKGRNASGSRSSEKNDSVAKAVDASSVRPMVPQ